MNHIPAWLTLAALIAAILGCIHEQGAKNEGLPLVHAALPTATPEAVVPWALNTRCSINSRNLPARQPEERT